MKQKNIKGLISEYFIFLIFIALVVVLTCLKPSFIAPTNLVNILKQASINGILAFGMMFVIIAGGFAERAGTLTGMERTILQYYMDGYTVKDIPELAHISASTVKTHNRNLYRKMEVDSFDELKVYIELFASCGRSGELLKR